jgi:peptide/nickel transport system permease protein/oligopeptide transport system permease protein
VGRYIVRRLLQFIPTVLGAMFLLHYLTVVGIQMTGNPVRAMFGDRTPSQAQLEATSAALGLNDPCLEREGDPCLGMFLTRMENVFLHFDFGINQRRVPVTELIERALPHTLKLAIAAFLINAIIGLIAGILAGLRNGSFWDYLVKISTVFFISVPVFVLGVVVREFVAIKMGNWLSGIPAVPKWISEGMFSPVYKAVDFPWASLVFPALVLASLSLATTARLTRTSLLENMRADYVRTARAKGLTTRRVVGIHTLRNSLIPVVTYLGVDLATLLAGAVVTETVFSVPGVGRLIAISARTGESYVVVAVATMIVLVVMVINLLVDLLYAVLDPRIRYE